MFAEYRDSFIQEVIVLITRALADLLPAQAVEEMELGHFLIAFHQEMLTMVAAAVYARAGEGWVVVVAEEEQQRVVALQQVLRARLVPAVVVEGQGCLEE